MPDFPPALAGQCVLVVEDEYLIAMEVKRWLQEAGAEVIGPVPDVDQAIDLIEDHRLDAAVLDINLGNGDTAYPIADRLDVLGVPYLFATGDVQPGDASTHGDRPHLAKPYLAEQLVNAVAKLGG